MHFHGWGTYTAHIAWSLDYIEKKMHCQVLNYLLPIISFLAFTDQEQLMVDVIETSYHNIFEKFCWI